MYNYRLLTIEPPGQYDNNLAMVVSKFYKCNERALKLFSVALSEAIVAIIPASSSTMGDEAPASTDVFAICIQLQNNPVNVALTVSLTFSGKASKCSGHYIKVLMFSHIIILKDYNYNYISLSHSHPQLLLISNLE